MGTKNGTKGSAVGHITFWDEDRIRGIVGWANVDFVADDKLLTPLSLNIEIPAVFQNLNYVMTTVTFFMVLSRFIIKWTLV